MKAARLYEYDPAMAVDLRIENVNDPTIQKPDEVVVKVGAAGLCRTDLHIIEGVWRDIMDPENRLLPYTMGHENAGWVEDVGSAVTSVKPGDAVICHPLRTCGICLPCRYGEDMHCETGLFPGLGLDGGFAEYFITSERSLIKLNPNVTPLDVAPMADAGITAYRAAKKAAKLLRPGAYCVLLGIGGLGHIALQCLKQISGARIIAIDNVPAAQALARELGADHVLSGGPEVVEEVRQITSGGAQVVIDFVGELGVENLCWQMVRKGGQMFVVGYGGKVEVPTVHFVVEEINVGGSLVR
ncbi:MAG: NAD(P)-dependent alcohol dehydrogenase, partial [Pseudomonadota bacterium]